MNAAERRAARDLRVAELTRAGWTAQRIAYDVGLSVRAVVAARGRTGTARPSPRFLTPAELEHAEAMLADGAPVAEVERTLGRAQGALSRRFAGRGWTHAEAGAFAMACRRAK